MMFAPPPNGPPPTLWQMLALAGYFLTLGVVMFSIGMYYKRRGK